MFKKNSPEEESFQPTPTQARPAPPSAPSGRTAAVIGRSIVVKGEVSGQEDLQVEGRVEGRIVLPEQQVVVGPTGRGGSRGRGQGDYCRGNRGRQRQGRGKSNHHPGGLLDRGHRSGPVERGRRSLSQGDGRAYPQGKAQKPSPLTGPRARPSPKWRRNRGSALTAVRRQ